MAPPWETAHFLSGMHLVSCTFGGIWDLLPAADHEALSGMIPQPDEVIFPEDGAAESDRWALPGRTLQNINVRTRTPRPVFPGAAIDCTGRMEVVELFRSRRRAPD